MTVRAEARGSEEREIAEAVNLCDARGRLLPASVGWSRRPLHTCNLRGHPLRKKRWNYWCITSDSYLFSVTLASVDYMGLAFAYFLERETGRFVEKTVTVPFGRGRVLSRLPGGTSGGPRDVERCHPLERRPLSLHLQAELPPCRRRRLPGRRRLRVRARGSLRLPGLRAGRLALRHLLELGLAFRQARRADHRPEPRRLLDRRDGRDGERDPR